MLIDALKLTPLSTIEARSESLKDVMLLSEYTFDRSRLEVVKWTLKCQKILLGSIEKLIVEGFEESMLWDMSGSDVTRIGIQTLTVIVGMALAGQTSTESMEKEIS